MCHAPIQIRKQLSEAIGIMSKEDYPDNWISLLPQLVTKLNEGNVNVIMGALQTTNSAFKRFRNTYMSENISNELGMAQRELLKPLFDVLKRLMEFLNSEESTKEMIETVVKCIKLVCRIFYSLNIFGLTEVIKFKLIKLK